MGLLIDKKTEHKHQVLTEKLDDIGARLECKKKKTPKLHGLSPQANYTDQLSDCRLSAKLVPTLADSGCCVVSTTIPPPRLECTPRK
jgi:hypothetical protein